MKSTSKNNLTPATPIANAEGNLTKKIFLVAADSDARQVLIQEIKKDGTHLVETVDNFDGLANELARTAPHLIVYYTSDLADAGTAIFSDLVRSTFLGLPVCVIHGDLSKNLWQIGFREVLAKPIRRWTTPLIS